MATKDDFNAILIPQLPVKKLKFSEYLHLGVRHKLFEGEYINKPSLKEDDQYFYYIVSGTIQTCFEREDGTFLILVHRCAGSGFQCEFRNFASIAGDRLKFVAQENTILVSFTQRQVYELMREDSDIFDDFLYTTHMFFASICHRILNTSSHSAKQRLLIWLKKLCEVNPPNPEGHHVISCRLTLQQIADLLFIHVSTCNKLINSLERLGVIKRSRKHICVYSLERILQLLEDEESSLD